MNAVNAEDPFHDSCDEDAQSLSLGSLDSGDHECSLLGYLALALPEDALLIADILHPSDMQWPLHKELYRRIIRAIRNGCPILESIADNLDPWLNSNHRGITPRKYLGHCLRVAAETPEQIEICIDRIQNAANRRRRYQAAQLAQSLACNETLTIERIDIRTNQIFRTARSPHPHSSPRRATPPEK